MSVDKTNMKWDNTGDASLSNTSMTEVVKYEVDWVDRYTEAFALIGKPHSDASWLICTDTSITKVGDVSDVTGRPQSAFINATFKSVSEAKRDGGVQAQDTVNWIVDVEIGGEALTLKWKDWEFSDVSLPNWPLRADESTNAVKIIPVGQVTVSGSWTTWDKTKIKGVIGKINKSDFHGFGAEELLFLGVSVTEQTSVDGNAGYAISYSFSWQPETWNKFLNFNEDPPAWQKLRKKGQAGVFPYTTAHFSDLSPSKW